MVNHRNSIQLDTTFGALADPVRRGLLSRLARGEASVSELAKPYQISMPAILKHLRVLQNAGLVASKKQGRVHCCVLVAYPMQTAADWIALYRPFWEKQLDSLAAYLENTQPKEKHSWKKSQPKRVTRFSSKRRSGRLKKKSLMPGPSRKS